MKIFVKCAVALVLAAAVAGSSLGCNTGKHGAPDAASGQAPNRPTVQGWEGTYQGVVPCADCEGIETTITLNADGSYFLRTKYVGREGKVVHQRGAFSWSSAGNSIRLSGVSGGPDQYLVNDQKLVQLDLQGNRITGELAGKYELSKVPGDVDSAPAVLAIPSRWRLRDLLGKPLPAPAADSAAPLLAFEPNRVHGFTGCNDFTGTCELMPGNRLHFSKIATTMKACPDGTVEQELLRILESTDNYFTDGKVLKLHRGRMAPLAVFDAEAEAHP